MLKKLTDHIFYKQQKFYSSFPSITSLENGELLLVFRRARDVRNLLDETKATDSDEIKLLKLQVDHIDSRSQLVSI
ncbi:MAG: exo-alpha-sialidase, partial [Pseudomonadota bacterium]